MGDIVNVIKNKNSIMLFIGLSVYVALFIIRDVIQINIAGTLFMFWFVGMILFLPQPEMMKAVFFMLPLSNGIPGYTILLTLGILVFKSHKFSPWQLIPPTIIAILELISVASYDFPIRLQSVISYIGFIYLFFYILFDNEPKIDKKACVRFFCYGTVVALLIVYIPIIMNYGILAIIAGEVRDGVAMGYDNSEDILGHLTMNANTIAYYAITLLSILLLGRKKLDISSNIILYVAIFIAVAAGLLSFSRTWLILTSTIIFLYILNSRSRLFAAILMVVLTLLIMTTQNSVVESIGGVYQTRMSDDNFQTGGGRFVIFRDYNRAWIDSPKYVIMGTGVTNYRQVLRQEYSMHNGLQQIWVCHGILGFAVFMLSVIKYMISFRNRRLNFIYYLPFISCFVFDQSIQFLSPYALMLPFLPTLYVLSFNKEKFISAYTPNKIEIPLMR